jgi:hypothetical protein
MLALGLLTDWQWWSLQAQQQAAARIAAGQHMQWGSGSCQLDTGSWLADWLAVVEPAGKATSSSKDSSR